MRLVAKGTQCNLKLEDKTTGALFANCPIETYPGVAIEAVSDSSRYFVIRVQDDNGRRMNIYIYIYIYIYFFIFKDCSQHCFFYVLQVVRHF